MIEEEIELSDNSGRRRLYLVSALVILVALIGLLLLCSPMASGYGLSTQACVGFTTTPKWQVGIAWSAPISSYLPPLMFARTKLCVNLPAPLTPSRINGEFMFPP